MKRPVKIKFQNGITYSIAVEEILNELTGEFDFIESDNPDFILFGPYGIDIPPAGKYTRIGYFCENITPDLSICDWAFGVPLESEVNNIRYKRIQWHNINPVDLIKKDWDIEKIFSSKTKFCNFLYSHPVAYRESFFKQLSKYKKVDAPGKSMNNMPSLESMYPGLKWDIKRKFISEYKFTIAFENYVYPGYQTEKLYDAMLSKSLPIYCGDPNIGEIFNTKSFLNTPDYVDMKQTRLVAFLERRSQMNFTDILPQYRKSAKDRVQRKLKMIGRENKMKLQFNKLDFSNLIDRIIEMDQDPDTYIACLKEPWFNNNMPPVSGSLKERWQEIFSK